MVLIYVLCSTESSYLTPQVSALFPLPNGTTNMWWIEPGGKEHTSVAAQGLPNPEWNNRWTVNLGANPPVEALFVNIRAGIGPGPTSILLGPGPDRKFSGRSQLYIFLARDRMGPDRIHFFQGPGPDRIHFCKDRTGTEPIFWVIFFGFS